MQSTLHEKRWFVVQTFAIACFGSKTFQCSCQKQGNKDALPSPVFIPDTRFPFDKLRFNVSICPFLPFLPLSPTINQSINELINQSIN
jgi:hypothetical protein